MTHMKTEFFMSFETFAARNSMIFFFGQTAALKCEVWPTLLGTQ